LLYSAADGIAVIAVTYTNTMKRIDINWKTEWKPLAISVGIALAVGGLSSLLTSGSMEAFEQLQQPPLSPPGVLFPIVWTILYTLMGISAYLVWRTKSELRDGTLRLYVVQLAVNFIWPLLFFRAQAFGFAFFWLLLLWALVVALIFRFSDIEPIAGWLQVPYLAWLTFAAYLNFGVLLLNG